MYQVSGCLSGLKKKTRNSFRFFFANSSIIEEGFIGACEAILKFTNNMYLRLDKKEAVIAMFHDVRKESPKMTYQQYLENSSRLISLLGLDRVQESEHIWLMFSFF